MQREKMDRERRIVEQRVADSTSYYSADDSAKVRARKRNAYQAELRRHHWEKIQVENEHMFMRLVQQPIAVDVKPSDFSLSRIGTNSPLYDGHRSLTGR